MYLLSREFFFCENFFCISLGVFIGIFFFSPCLWQALMPQVWTTPERLSWSWDPPTSSPYPSDPGLSRAAPVGGSHGGPRVWEPGRLSGKKAR